MDERKLILGLKRGDHDSYETLFKLYYAKFVNFADAIIKDRNAAKDIVVTENEKSTKQFKVQKVYYPATVNY